MLNRSVSLILVGLALAVFLLAQLGLLPLSGPVTAPSPDATAPIERAATPSVAPASSGTDASSIQRASSLPTIAYADLPPEAHDTIYLIDQGGSFPYEKDGATFQNREGILPDKPTGYYQEYTVITPGEDDRGARRLVGGGEGELYYTDDHYRSFREVIR